MTDHIFLSYSRQELTFADCLRQELQAEGVDVWTDIERLEVGEDWQPQIDRAVDEASTLLLVVSNESIASENVCREWVRAMEQGKRIILILFEPCPMNGEQCLARLKASGKPTHDAYAKRGDWDALAACEIVDFRQAFDAALQELLDRLNNKTTSTGQAPLPKLLRPPEVRWFLRLIHAQINSVIAALLLTFGIVVVLPTAQTAVGIEDAAFYLVVWAIILGIPLAGLLGAWWFARRQFRRRHHDYGRQILLLTFTLLSMLFLILTVAGFDALDWEDLRGTINLLNTTLVFVALIQGAVAVVQFMMLGSAGLYRWSGPSGIPVVRRHYRRNWMVTVAAAIIFALTAIITGNGTATLLTIIMLWVLLYLSAQRATARYRGHHIKFQRPDQQMKVVVLHAPQDDHYAQRIQHAIKRYHILTPLVEADVVIAIVSRFYRKLDAAPEPHQEVIPIWIEDVPDIDPELGRLQRVDWRDGVSGDELRVLASMLDKPQRMLAQLGEFPRRLRSVRPPGVKRTRRLLGVGLVSVTIILATWQVFDVLALEELPEETSQAALGDLDVNIAWFGSFDESVTEVRSFHCFLFAEPGQTHHNVDTITPGRPVGEIIAAIVDKESLDVQYFENEGDGVPSALNDCTYKPALTDTAFEITFVSTFGILLLGGLGLFTIHELTRRQGRFFPGLALKVVVAVALLIIVGSEMYLLPFLVYGVILIQAGISSDVRTWIPNVFADGWPFPRGESTH